MSFRNHASLATLSAQSTSLMPPPMSMPIEKAVDDLSLWYFDLEEPDGSTCWPLPEECSLHEDEHELEVVLSPSVSTSAAVTITSTEDASPPKGDLNMNMTDSQSLSFRDHGNLPSSACASPAPTSGQYTFRTPLSSRHPSLQRASSIPSLTIGTINELEVTKFTIRRNEKSVMYHIDVRGGESQLQTYTIRRSYTDFKHLHAALTIIVESKKEHYQVMNLMKDVKERPSSEMSRGTSTQDLTGDANAKEPWFVNFELPPLPSAGLLSFWRRHDRAHLQNRVAMFNRLLSAVMQHQDLRDNFAMQKFLSIAPCAIRDRGSSYVSLCDYGVPHLAFEEESRERKKLARVRRRNSSASATSLVE